MRSTRDRMSMPVVVAIGLTWIFALPVCGAEPAPSSPIANLHEVEGLVRIVRGPKQEVLAGEDEMELAQGDEIETLEGAAATITFQDNHIIKLSENSHLVLASLRAETSSRGFFGRVRLLGGQLVASFEKLAGSGAGFEVATATAVAAVKGTTFAVEAGEQGGTVSVLEGTVTTVAVREDGTRGEAVLVHEQETAEVNGTDRRPTRPRRFEEAGRWAGMRERLTGVRDFAVEHRRRKHSGELDRDRRLRRLSRAAHVMRFMRQQPQRFSTLPPAQQAHLKQFVAKHREGVEIFRVEIEAFDRAHPEWVAKLDRMAQNRLELHRRLRNGPREKNRERRPGRR